jgi:hypothetical protein
MGRRFGIEIEFGLRGNASLTDVLNAVRAAGLSTRTSLHGYTGNSMTEWVVKTDGSVSHGGELVSPPLDFEDPDQRGQVDKAIAALVAAGAKTYAQAGIHVHIESNDFAAKDLSALSRVVTKFEDCLYRIASSGWQTMRPGARTYCKPLSAEQASGLAKARTDDQVKRAYYGQNYAYASGHGHSSRYYGLNLHSHFYRGTVEFRVFNSSLNAARCQTYIAVCMALMVDAKSGRLRSIAKSYRLGAMASGQVTEEKALFNFLQVLRYQAGMSLEDYKNVKRFWRDSRPQAGITGGY